MLAALDPVIARMLALYWVDRSPKDGLYLVRGDMADPSKTIVDGWAFTADHAPTPGIDGPIEVRQLPEIEYRGPIARGRTALAWRRPDRRRLLPARPVAVDVVRRAGAGDQLLTQDAPRLIPSDGDRCVTDTGVPLDVDVVYTVTPIDVFGRRGEPAAGSLVRLRDLASPVPPTAVRASVIQPGLPWADAAGRELAADGLATLRTTLEFGEAQRRASPDAVSVQWLWRTGPRPAGDLPPEEWNALADVRLGAVAESTAVLGSGPAALEWEATVTEVRRIEPADAAGARLGLAMRDAADLPAIPDAAVVELLLDTTLLESDVFPHHEARLSGLRARVVSGSSGLAAHEDLHPDGRMTARIAIEDGRLATSVAPGDTIAIRHTVAPGWSGQALRDWLRLGTGPGVALPPLRLRVPMDTLADGAARAVGGEVAIDVAVRLEPDLAGAATPRPVPLADPEAGVRTVLARLVGQRSAGDKLDLLLCAPRDGALLLLLAAATPGVDVRVRRHPPFAAPPVRVAVRADADATAVIRLDLGPERRFGTLWISAVAVDRGGLRSGRMARVAEVSVVAPPPLVAPTAPYPEREGRDAAAGWASPPDATGIATLAIAWVPLPDPHDAAARFEVARGLDATIVANDRQRWLRGGSAEHFAGLGIVAGPAADGTLRAGWSPAPGGRGFVVTLASDAATAEAIEAIGTGRARIEHTVDGAPRMLHHRLLRVVRGGATVTQLLCSPDGPLEGAALGDIAEGAALRVEGPPAYDAVRAEPAALRALADRDPGLPDGGEQAFSLVTGTPVAGHRFVDRLPGRGTNSLLYKVRAVFPGEVRSAWSPASVACRAPSLDRPAPPRRTRVSRDGAATVHEVELPASADLTGIRLLRASAGEPPMDWRELSLDDGAAPVSPARIAATRTLLDVRGRVPDGPLSLDVAPRLTGVFAADVDRAAPPPGAGFLVDVRREIATLSPDPGGRALALRVERVDGTIAWIDRVEARHEIVLDDADVGDHDVSIQAVRRVAIGDRVVELRSEPVALTPAAGGTGAG